MSKEGKSLCEDAGMPKIFRMDLRWEERAKAKPKFRGGDIIICRNTLPRTRMGEPRPAWMVGRLGDNERYLERGGEFYDVKLAEVFAQAVWSYIKAGRDADQEKENRDGDDR